MWSSGAGWRLFRRCGHRCRPDPVPECVRFCEDGTVLYGKCEFLGLKENGAGLADNEYFQKNVPDEIKKTIEEKKQEVLDGKIEIPTALGDADQNEVQALIDSVAP